MTKILMWAGVILALAAVQTVLQMAVHELPTGVKLGLLALIVGCFYLMVKSPKTRQQNIATTQNTLPPDLYLDGFPPISNVDESSENGLSPFIFASGLYDPKGWSSFTVNSVAISGAYSTWGISYVKDGELLASAAAPPWTIPGSPVAIEACKKMGELWDANYDKIMKEKEHAN